MLNIVWLIFIILSVTYGIFSGNLSNLNSFAHPTDKEIISTQMRFLIYSHGDSYLSGHRYS